MKIAPALGSFARSYAKKGAYVGAVGAVAAAAALPLSAQSQCRATFRSPLTAPACGVSEGREPDREHTEVNLYADPPLVTVVSAGSATTTGTVRWGAGTFVWPAGSPSPWRV